jgi:hypothetical protein
MSKKKAAGLLAGLLVTVSGILYKCQDDSNLFSTPAPSVQADAGVAP